MGVNWQGVGVVNKLGLVLEVYCGENLSAFARIVRLAEMFPSLTIVLNHCGLHIGPAFLSNPEIYPNLGAPEKLSQWRAGIASLSPYENVILKLGGIQMASNGFGFDGQPTPPSSKAIAAQTRKYYSHCLTSFGADRCMFESNVSQGTPPSRLLGQ